MSYQEKLICGQFVPMVVVCAVYFSSLARTGRPASLFGSILGLAVLQVIYMILVASLSKKEDRDERDRLIEYKAYKVGYLVLMSVGVCWVGLLVTGMWTAEQLTAAPVILGVWVGVEIVRTGTMLALHRLGVSA